MQVQSVTGLPALFPFTLIVAPGTSTAEVITVTQAATGSGPYTFSNCIRGDDGTTASAHSVNTVVQHGVAARDMYRGGSGWVNVLQEAYGADPTGVADSTSAINAALAAGGTVYLPAGTYKLSGALTVPTGTVVQGDGQNVTILNQTSTSADTLSGTDQRFITIRDLQLSGPSSGTGRGIALLHSAQALAGINVENVIVQNFGGDGVHVETPITSVLTAVRSQGNGGHGYFMSGGTSVVFNGCYANANTVNGFEIDAANYTTLNACASDSNVIGYSVNGSSAVVLNGCGTESCTDGYKILGASANILLQACKVFGETGIGFWVTGNSVFCSLVSCREASPGVGATASFQVDSGSTATVISPENTTGTNYAAGSTNFFFSTNLEIHSAGTATARVSRNATSNTARYTVQTANSDRWAFGLAGDGTDNAVIADLGHSTTALQAVYQVQQPNMSMLGTAPSYGGGTGVTWLANATTSPGTNPSGGVFLYASGGHLFAYPSSGTAVQLA